MKYVILKNIEVESEDYVSEMKNDRDNRSVFSFKYNNRFIAGYGLNAIISNRREEWYVKEEWVQEVEVHEVVAARLQGEI